MLDEPTLKRKVFLRLLGSPGSVFPFLAGMTAMTTSWALDWKPGIGLFAGLAGLLFSVGSFITRLVLSGDKVAARVLKESDQAKVAAQQQALDRLDQRLTTADQDPRPEAALRDLRALVKAFEDYSARNPGVHTGNLIEIQSRTGLLFDQCVESLDQTDALWQIARKLNTPVARQPILDQREKLIADVQASIKQLSDTLVALQRLGAGDHSNAQLSQLRDELDRSLEVAKAVEERVSNLVKEASVMSLPSLTQTKPRT